MKRTEAVTIRLCAAAMMRLHVLVADFNAKHPKYPTTPAEMAAAVCHGELWRYDGSQEWQVHLVRAREAHTRHREEVK